MQDIVTREDIEMLVNRFYARVQEDELLAPVFAHVDWVYHLPIMHSFWASMMLGERTYSGNPFQKHIGLSIQSKHFDAWLGLFIVTVDELFTGEKADEIKMRANSIANLFQHKLGLMKV